MSLKVHYSQSVDTFTFKLGDALYSATPVGLTERDGEKNRVVYKLMRLRDMVDLGWYREAILAVVVVSDATDKKDDHSKWCYKRNPRDRFMIVTCGKLEMMHA